MLDNALEEMYENGGARGYKTYLRGLEPLSEIIETFAKNNALRFDFFRYNYRKAILFGDDCEHLLLRYHT
jgi:hypothetical protein